MCRQIKRVYCDNSILRSEQNVSNLVSTICERADKHFAFPDDPNKQGPVVNIATAVVLPVDVSHNLLDAHNVGRVELRNWVENRLIQKPELFWDTLPPMNLKNFSCLNKNVAVKSKSTGVISEKGDRELFSKMLIAANKRDFNLRAVLKYELSPVPLAIAHFNGEMQETCKSSLLKELEFNTEAAANIQTVQSDCAYIIDLMAVVHSTSKRKLKTFDELSHSLSNCIVSGLPYADHVYIVPDR